MGGEHKAYIMVVQLKFGPWIAHYVKNLHISYCRCVAENAAGRAETKCNLTIKPPTKPPGSEELIQPEVVRRAHAPPPKPDDVRCGFKFALI